MKTWMKLCVLIICCFFVVLMGCVSTGTLGIISKSLNDSSGSLLTAPHPYKELGPAKGHACRFILFGIVPSWGDTTVAKATQNALEESGGDALINVTVTNSLFTAIPVFLNVICITCSSVEGTAIKFVPQQRQK